MICSFNFLIFLAVCLNISTVINIKILTNFNQQTQSYKFTSHIAAFLCGFDHRDAWNLHTNIIWSKRSTDFKELSPCSVWYHLNGNNNLQVDMSLHSDNVSRVKLQHTSNISIDIILSNLLLVVKKLASAVITSNLSATPIFRASFSMCRRCVLEFDTQVILQRG